MTQTALDTHLLDRLHDTLKQEIAQYHQAVDALQRKKSALVSRKPQQLIPVDRELMAILRKSGQLEAQRQELMTALGHPDGRLEALMERMNQACPNEVSRFQDVRQRLLRTIEDVGELNRESRSLLDLSLNWVQETVELIAAAVSPEGASYDAHGGKKKGKNKQPPIQSTINHSA